MNVIFKGVTVPENVENITDAEQFIAYCAKVSNPKKQTENGANLIKYLIRENHWSPFEMVSMTLEIQTTRDIGRQIIRHRSFAFQEYSQRYAEVGLQFEFREARLQDTKNRQNSISVDDPVLQMQWDAEQAKVMNAAEGAYKWALKNGIAKEQARVVLPEGLTPTTMYMAGTLRSWIHYCDLRAANGTQLEHMYIAKAALEIIKEKFPNIYTALTEISEKREETQKLYEYVTAKYPNILEQLRSCE